MTDEQQSPLQRSFAELSAFLVSESECRHKDLRMLQKHYRHRIKPTIDGAHILDGVLNDADD